MLQSNALIFTHPMLLKNEISTDSPNSPGGGGGFLDMSHNF